MQECYRTWQYELTLLKKNRNSLKWWKKSLKWWKNSLCTRISPTCMLSFNWYTGTDWNDERKVWNEMTKELSVCTRISPTCKLSFNWYTLWLVAACKYLSFNLLGWRFIIINWSDITIQFYTFNNYFALCLDCNNVQLAL